MKRTLIATAMAGSLLALSACSSGPTALQSAWEECDEADLSEGIGYDEEYDVLSVTGAGIQEDGTPTAEGIGAWFAWECIRGALEIPGHVVSHMESTTSLQGRQEASWGDMAAAWSYHPNNGFNATIEGSLD